MPSYSYTAINDAGIKKKGILSADSEREARKLVKDCLLYTSPSPRDRG